MEHFIRLTSHNSDTENLIKTTLPHHINLHQSGTWKVALSSVYIQIDDSEDDLFLEVKDNEGKTRRFVYDFKESHEVSDLITRMNVDVYNTLGWYLADFNMFVADGQLTVDCFRKISLRFSKNLGYKLGNVSNGYDGACKWFKLDRSRLVLTESIDMSRKIKQHSLITVKSNIAAHAILSDKFDNILKTLYRVKVPGEGDYYYEAKHLEYIDVSNSILSDLIITFHDQFGNDLNLQKNCTNFVNLIFKHFV